MTKYSSFYMEGAALGKSKKVFMNMDGMLLKESSMYFQLRLLKVVFGWTHQRMMHVVWTMLVLGIKTILMIWQLLLIL